VADWDGSEEQNKQPSHDIRCNEIPYASSLQCHARSEQSTLARRGTTRLSSRQLRCRGNPDFGTRNRLSKRWCGRRFRQDRKQYLQDIAEVLDHSSKRKRRQDHARSPAESRVEVLVGAPMTEMKNEEGSNLSLLLDKYEIIHVNLGKDF
jgi:hypothetical protein